MPAKTKEQKQLMAYAYACKTGKAKNCPANIQKIGKSMSTKQLKDFFEGIIYKTKKTNKDLLQNFLIWMDNTNIDYIYNDEDGNLEIYNEKELSREDNKMLLQYLQRLNLEKIWEFESPGGTTYANIGNVTGHGSVRPAAQVMGNGGSGSGVEFTGSGDRFDNYSEDDEDDDEKEQLNKKKRKKHIEHIKKKIEDDTNDKKQKQKQKESMSFKQFENDGILVSEGRIQAKRKYTEKYPSINVNSNTPVRNKILSFISKNGPEVSEEKMKEFFNSIEEEEGKKPNWNWMSSNKQYVKKIGTESGNFYKLTERGQRILNSQMESTDEYSMDIKEAKSAEVSILMKRLNMIDKTNEELQKIIKKTEDSMDFSRGDIDEELVESFEDFYYEYGVLNDLWKKVKKYY